ncbi:MAG: four helix bundle protein [Myxococcales bacterium]
MSTLYLESVGLASDVRALLSPIARRDQDLAKRLRRACDGVPEHIAEGMCLTGRPRRVEYEAARISAREAMACLRAAEGVGFLSDGGDRLYSRIEGIVRRISTTLEN